MSLFSPTRRDFLQHTAAGAALGAGTLSGSARGANLTGPVNAFTWGGRIIQSESTTSRKRPAST